jgi:hypothetical protein
MVNMSRGWIANEMMSLTQMLITLHLPVLLLALGILYWRQQQGLIFTKQRKEVSVKVIQA